MDVSTHVLDPEGDVIIVLKKCPEDLFSSSTTGSEYRIQASSKHLTLASAYFKSILDSKWAEGRSLQDKGTTEINASDFDLEAFIIVMNAVHGRQNKVPRVISVDIFSKIATVVDYYMCHNVVDMCKEVWLHHLKKDLETSIIWDSPNYSINHLTIWVWISWVFGLDEEFRCATHNIAKRHSGIFAPPDIPIPGVVIETINNYTWACADGLRTSLDKLLQDLRDGKHGCGFDCQSILYGALSLEIHRNSLSVIWGNDCRPQVSFESLLRQIESFKSPGRCQSCRYGYHSTEHCGLKHYIDSEVLKAAPIIRGLELSSFSCRGGDDAESLFGK
ncbi:hypothetical protein FE257_010854 [Aspergillus nanangensis]|uniref:BTB domain-containing protein n=1 Tax=Aspergillus nanangensis TaxID=2582783 RepID=A0AAD4CW40_ASPNN|nr:hypothetical protein FE257_010854 [Aspergillus nanangensis]